MRITEKKHWVNSIEKRGDIYMIFQKVGIYGFSLCVNFKKNKYTGKRYFSAEFYKII